MSIAFFCPHCGKGHVVRDAHAGRPAQCSCGKAIVVPLASEPPPLPPLPAWTSQPPPLPPIAPAVAPPPPPPAVAWPVARQASGLSWIVVAAISAGSAIVAALVVVAVLLPMRSTGIRPTATPMPPAATPAVPPTVPTTPLAQPVRPDGRSQSAGTMSPSPFAPPARADFTPSPPGIATTRAVRRDWPPDAEWTSPAPGIREMRVTVDTFTKQRTQLRVYLPADAPAGVLLPCVFIAPAGSRLYHGMDLVNADAAEHWPYVRAGFAVIAYSVSGPLSAEDARNPQAVKRACDAFFQAVGGFWNANAAIEYAIARRPEIDRDRLYVAGHSSAGTIALLVASRDPRVKGCCAYAPAVDLDADLAGVAASLEPTIFGFKMRVHSVSPIAQFKPRGPVMLFHADDDATVSSDELQRYVERVGARLITCPTGGHYQSMIDHGIPAGIEFLKQLDAAQPTRRR